MVIMVKFIYSGKAVNLSAFRHMTHDANVDHQRPELFLWIWIYLIGDWSIIHDIIMYMYTIHEIILSVQQLPVTSCRLGEAGKVAGTMHSR